MGDPGAAQARWGDDEQRSERALPDRRCEGYRACEEEAGPVLVYGISAGVVYGLNLRFVSATKNL